MSTPEPEVGPAEQEMAARVAEGWLPVTIEQRGPDGSEVIGMLIFNVCPVCMAVIPPSDDEHPFTIEHAAWHVEQARTLDALRRRSVDG